MTRWLENTDRRRVLVLTRQEWLDDFETYHRNGEQVVGPRAVDLPDARGTRGLRREVLQPYEGLDWKDIARLVRVSDGKPFAVAEWWPMGEFHRFEGQGKSFNERPHLCVVEV